MDAKLTIIILDAEIIKVSSSIELILKNDNIDFDKANKLDHVKSDLLHIKRHLNYLIKKYEKTR